MTAPGYRWADVRPCGTPAAYRRHLRHGERPCAACLLAEATEKSFTQNRAPDPRRERYRMLRAAGIPAPRAKRLKDVRPDRWPAALVAVASGWPASTGRAA